MQTQSLEAALEREHRDIDDAIDAFTGHVDSPHLVRPQLRHAIRALRRHIYLEEQFLFPALHRAGLVAPVLVMLREHGQIWVTRWNTSLGPPPPPTPRSSSATS